MAKKREPEIPVESEPEEEEYASSEEEGSQESDSDQEQILAAKKPSISTPAAFKKTLDQSTQQEPVSSDEEESGSESDSDVEAPNVKPLASKPMIEPEKPKDGGRKLRSKSVNSEIVTPVKSTAVKRPAEDKETNGTDAKRSKRKLEPEGSEKKSTALFQRLWSEDDEIEILKGMIDYWSKKKTNPVADMTAFHDFIKKNLQVDVSSTQLKDKIKRLKKKYMNNKGKEKEGKDRTFTNPHEQQAYDLSKKVWGSENGKEKEVGRANIVVKDVKNVDYYGPNVEGRIERIGMELFETGKGVEGEEEWKRLKMEEMEAYQKLMEVKSAQSKLVIHCLRTEGGY